MRQGLLLAILKLRSITGFDKVSVNIFFTCDRKVQLSGCSHGDRGKRQRKICIAEACCIPAKESDIILQPCRFMMQRAKKK